MKSPFALAPAPWQQWMGAFVVEVSVRPCELPLAFDAFSQTYQAPPRQEGKFVMDQSWFESCTCGAKPCQLAVYEALSLNSAVVRKRRRCAEGDNFNRFPSAVIFFMWFYDPVLGPPLTYSCTCWKVEGIEKEQHHLLVWRWVAKRLAEGTAG